MIERRLSWRSVSPIYADQMEQQYGRSVWRTCPAEMWDALPWHEQPTVVTFTGDERMDQYRQLKAWADSHEQPIRDVRLEEREVVDPNHGWKEVTNAS